MIIRSGKKNDKNKRNDKKKWNNKKKWGRKFKINFKFHLKATAFKCEITQTFKKVCNFGRGVPPTTPHNKRELNNYKFIR